MNRQVTAAAGVPALVARDGFSSNFLNPNMIDYSNLQGFHIRAVNPHAPSPTVQQWSFGLQREFGNRWTMQLDYVGTKSTHLDLIYDYNQRFVVANKSTGITPYPNFGYIEYTTPAGFGNYNGLQGSVSRRTSQGLTLRAGLTYSRSLDDTPEELETSSGGAPNGRNLGAWCGPSDFNIPSGSLATSSMSYRSDTARRCSIEGPLPGCSETSVPRACTPSTAESPIR
ncbi:hypothetical protein RBB78_00545 [Tunturiibacter empetritectus]|uniref:hypothetical protein n=1 Tax=Tunturiibacter empetritectus TaxID=3069691 RepID=UPI003D9B8240